MNIFGIGLANGPQDINRVRSVGFDHYLALEGQIDDLLQCTGERYLRLMSHDFLRVPVSDLANHILEWRKRGVRHIIPWNEANLPQEQDQSTDLTWNYEWQRNNYARVAQRYLELLDAVKYIDVVLHFPGWSPNVWYRECFDQWKAAAMAAPVTDVHVYGNYTQMMEITDWYLSVLPQKELLVSEFNFGAGNEVDPNWWADEAVAFYTGLLDRPQIIAACGFIWKWWNPDSPLKTTLDWEGQPIEDRVRNAPKPERRTQMWIATGAINLIRQLPTRAGATPYPERSLSGVDTLGVHYAGDPDLNGSEYGYGDVSAYQTAAYQTGPEPRDKFPAIAYGWLIHPDKFEQCHAAETETWGIASNNNHTRHVLITNIGKRGRPSDWQLETLTRLWTELEEYAGHPLKILGHKQVNPNSECPGYLVDEWLGDVRTRRLGTQPLPADIPGFVIKDQYTWECVLTGAEIAFRMLEWYRTYDGLRTLGYPRTKGWRWEGKKLIKYFQRARVEVVPSALQPDGSVDPAVPFDKVFQLGLLGDELLQQRGEL